MLTDPFYAVACKRQQSNGAKKTMKNYLAYWKRGWWALALIISINIILAVAYGSLAFLLRPFLANPFPVAVVIAWLAVGAPIAGLLFEKFAGWSKRLDRE